MTERLETQRPPSKKHVRPNARTYARGYDTNPHATWGETGPNPLNKAAAGPGQSFPSEPTVTAQDAANAAKLGPLGYVAAPTSAWTGGQRMRVGPYDFYWNGTAWTAGSAP